MKKLAGDVITYWKDMPRNARKYPWALFKPRVVRGYFKHSEHRLYQQLFFQALLKAGFKRTRWQLVLPGQTAGLVKRIPKREDGTNQYHERFYEDGVIDCEVEHHNFHIRHWSGAREKSENFLEDILEHWVKDIGEEASARIRQLFGTKEHGI